MVPNQEFAAALDRLRISQGLSLRDLVKTTGVARSTLSDALAGRRLPRLQTVLAVVQVCGGDIELWRQRWAALADPQSPVQATETSPRPAELPRAILGFAGRDAELCRLGSGPLWVVHGPPGVGKTALAVHWGYQVAADHPDGQLFLDLHGHHALLAPMSAGNALSRLLRSLGAQRIPVEVPERSRLLRSMLASKRMVIVLDDAVSADQIRPLLPGGIGCSVLVTSRHHLIELTALDGAERLALDVLPPDSSAAVIAQVAGAARVLAQPAETAAVAAACGHLPLALRLVAATLALDPTLGIDELSERLAAGHSALPEVGRHLDAVFATSYRTLAPDAQLVFRRLSLHPGAEPDLAAAAVLAELPIQRTRTALFELAEAHLAEAAGAGHYRIHDLLREYAERLLAGVEGTEQAARLRTRLLDWYVEQAAAVSATLAPGSARLYLPADQHAGRPMSEAEANRWLEAQQGNLVAAIAADSEGRHAWALIDLLGVVLLRRRDIADLLVATDAGIAVAERQGDRAAVALVRTVRAWLHWRQGNVEAARADFEQALAGFDQQHAAGRAAVLLGLVAPCAIEDELELAERYARQALDCYRALGDRHGLATTMNALANLDHRQGRLAEAAEHFLASADLLRQVGDRGSLAIALGNLTWVYARSGRLAEAVGHSAEAVLLARSVTDRYAETLALINGAVAREQAAQLAEALRWATDAAALADQLGDRSFQASALDALATIERRCGTDQERVAALRRQALKLSRHCRDRASEANILLSAARDGCQRPAPTTPHGVVDWAGAATLAGQALALAQECGARYTEAEALSVLAACALSRPGLPAAAEAVELAAAAVQLHVTAGVRLGEARSRTILAAALHRSGQPLPAESHWQQARQIFRELQVPEADQLAERISHDAQAAEAAFV